MEKNEEEKEAKQNYNECGMRPKPRGFRAGIAECGIKRLFRRHRSDDNALDGPEKDDQEDAELH